MRPLSVMLSILIIFSIWILPVCSISPEVAKVILAATENQATSASSGSSTTQGTNSFDHYIVNYFDNSNPEIYCFSGSSLVGYITFYLDASPPPVPNAIEEGTQIHISYPISQLNDVMNMLRYTNGTLSLHINGPYAGLQTGML